MRDRIRPKDRHGSCHSGAGLVGPNSIPAHLHYGCGVYVDISGHVDLPKVGKAVSPHLDRQHASTLLNLFKREQVIQVARRIQKGPRSIIRAVENRDGRIGVVSDHVATGFDACPCHLNAGVKADCVAIALDHVFFDSGEGTVKHPHPVGAVVFDEVVADMCVTAVVYHDTATTVRYGEISAVILDVIVRYRGVGAILDVDPIGIIEADRRVFDREG